MKPATLARRTALVLTIVGATLVSVPTAGAENRSANRLPTVDELPPGTVQLTPHMPGMGEHWANPKDLPLGPIYCVMDGKVICAELMIAQQDFLEGRSFERVSLGMKGRLPPVDHLELTFMPDGHEGFEEPHYDLHLYFVPPRVRFLTRAAP